MKSDSLTLRAHAKINLFLDIAGRLPNGYHILNTVMREIGLSDRVTVSVSEGSGIFLTCDHPQIPCDARNIAVRAAEKFLVETGSPAAVRIRIEKRIPIEAGLGGSSTDGAAVLTALNRLFGEPLSKARLSALGAALGADVPFCLTGGTAICGGIGEKITPITIPDDFTVAVVKPDFSCPTAGAYRAYDKSPLPVREDFSAFVQALPHGVSRWSGGVYNVFEQLYRDPRIEALTGSLKKNGALAAALSGSGSAVFGIFGDEKTAEEAVGKIDALFCKIIRSNDEETED